MSSSRALGSDSSGLPFKLFDLQSCHVSPASRFYAEDGWIFREYPGKGIELVCRYEPPARTAEPSGQPGA